MITAGLGWHVMTIGFQILFDHLKGLSREVVVAWGLPDEFQDCRIFGSTLSERDAANVAHVAEIRMDCDPGTQTFRTQPLTDNGTLPISNREQRGRTGCFSHARHDVRGWAISTAQAIF